MADALLLHMVLKRQLVNAPLTSDFDFKPLLTRAKSNFE